MGRSAREGIAMYHICIHGSRDSVCHALQVGAEALCPSVRLGNETLRGGDRGVIYPVEATSPHALGCWIRDVNDRCQQKRVHQVTVLRHSSAHRG